MRVSEQGITLIKEFEGFSPTAYLCQAKVWTIGYGHTDGVKKGDTCSKEEAIEFFKKDVQVVERNIKRLVKVELNQNQFDALVSFVFNIGVGAFSKSTMLRFINVSHFPLAAGQFDRWIYTKDKISNGLIKRRKAEKDLFLK